MRVWGFGCSFTQYFYPTWADILIHNAEQQGHTGENWGSCGKGNLYIANKVMECHARNQLGPNDYVFICWSNYFREDAYTDKRGWHTPRHIFTQTQYNDGTVNGFGSAKYYAMRDHALMQSTRLSLQALGVNQYNFSILPMSGGDQDIDTVCDVYRTVFDGPPMMESLDLMLQDEETKRNRIRSFPPENPVDTLEEWHPLPHEHLDYVEKYIQPKINWLNTGVTENTKQFVDNWKTKLFAMPQPIDLGATGWHTNKGKQWI
jgi:hypothetical protein